MLTFVSSDNSTRKQIRADKVFLAAGAPVSTRLALDCAGVYDQWFHFGHTLAFAFAVLLPRFLGSVLPDAGHAMAVLSWEINGPSLIERVCGSLYLPTGVLDSDVIRFMPFSRPGAIAMWKQMRGAILIGNGFLSSDFSRTKIRLRRSDRHLEFQTEPNALASAEMVKAVKLLRRQLRRAGAYVMPASLKTVPEGADFHYGASLPYLGSDRNGTDAVGQLAELDGLHVIDGAVLPRLPSRHPTLTIMANADRIARAVSACL